MRLSSKTLSNLNTKSLFVAFVISMGVISFIVTGIGFKMSSRLESTIAAKVGSQLVSVRALTDAAQQLDSQAGGQLDESKRQANVETAMNQLVQEKVMVEESQRIGWRPSDLEVAEWIRRIPAFKSPTTKQFDKTLYQKFIKSGQMSELELFERGRDSLSTDKFYQLLQIPAYVPTSIAEQMAKRDATQFDVEYLEVKPLESALQASVSAEAKKYAADPANLKKLQDAYTAAKDEFKQKAGVHIKTLLVAYKGAERAEGAALNRDEATAKAQAEDVLKKLRAGVDFAQATAAGNDDAKAQASHGDVGWVDDTSIDPDTFKAASALSKDKKLSDVIRTPFGFRVVEWMDSRPASEKKFDDVKEELALRQVGTTERTKQTSALQNEINTALSDKDHMKLDNVVKNRGLVWKKISKPISVSSRFVEELGVTDSVMGPLFALKNPGDTVKKTVDISGRNFVFRLISRKDGPAPDEKKVTDARRMAQIRALQAQVPEVQKKLVEVYTRNKDVQKNNELLSAR